MPFFKLQRLMPIYETAHVGSLLLQHCPLLTILFTSIIIFSQFLSILLTSLSIRITRRNYCFHARIPSFGNKMLQSCVFLLFDVKGYINAVTRFDPNSSVLIAQCGCSIFLQLIHRPLPHALFATIKIDLWKKDKNFSFFSN